LFTPDGPAEAKNPPANLSLSRTNHPDQDF
jgi:hypothetical protein